MNTKKTHTSYQLIKNGKKCGFLIGTFHMHLNPNDYQSLKHSYSPIIHSCSSIFTECKIRWNLQQRLGSESAIIEILNAENRKPIPMESNILQITFLLRMLRLGKLNIFIPIPYRIIKIFPLLFYCVLCVLHTLFFFLNIFLMIVTYKQYISYMNKMRDEANKTRLKLFNQFIKGEAPHLTKNRRWLCMEERDTFYTTTIIESSSQECAYFVGCSHLAGPNGMVAQLKKAGFELIHYPLPFHEKHIQTNDASKKNANDTGH